ncbi:hypothetical protein [Pseudofulvibacter geojedonensis]|uniref:Lipoprotein n=1 Tax=Pseudofulvibacter geojedonensis TaxID=1123758 RepID=A0ABW3I2K6_9FLAO
MKKLLVASIICASIFSCKKEENITYKYADQPSVLTCEISDNKLYTEAYYTFENAILTHAKNTNRNPNRVITLDQAMRNFVSRSRGVININDYVTKESLDVFKALHSKGLWNGEKLKSQSDVLNCIGKSISNKDLKTSFNALRSVEESLDPKLIVSAIVSSNNRSQYKDKALMTYIALDAYFGKFIGKDFSKIEFLKAKEETPAVTKPEVTLKKDPHAGHNHGPNDGHNH